MRRLPYLNGIRAFEASARAGSFAGAAKELNVTPAAISRMVRLLEQRLGVALFEREANRLALTPPGRAIRPGLTQIFDALAQPDRPGEDAAGKPGADRRGRADLCDPLADPAPRRVRQDRARGRRAHHHRRRRGAVQRRLDLRHQARRRRLAGACCRTAVRRGPDAGVCAAARGADKSPGDARGRRRCCGSRTRRTIGRAGSQAAGLALAAKGPVFEYYGQALQAARMASASRSASGPTSTTISRPGGSLRRSRSRCRRASNGIWCSASSAARSRAFWRSAAGSCARRARRMRTGAGDAQSRHHAGRRSRSARSCRRPALAHTGESGGGFISGFAHPIFGPDHVVAMVAVGLWGAFLGRPAIWLLPVVFPLVMALGGVLGILGVPMPGVETGIAMSAVVLGLMVAFAARPPLWVAAVLVGAFAIFHGYAHGAELPDGADAVAYLGRLRGRDRPAAPLRHRLRPAGALAGRPDRGARGGRRDRARRRRLS